ncbi:TRAP transporter permease [Novispirillum sp. DQ9]|uniref:TRAP transporter permease n=1 Tax=Novispirillum sp. DQ9 TaxID=3398612 RepID=UPI003C7D05E9
MTVTAPQPDQTKIIASGVDDDPAALGRPLGPWESRFFFAFCVVYTAFHLLVLNVFPMETWSFRIVHVAGGLMIGFGLFASMPAAAPGQPAPLRAAQWVLFALTGVPVLYALAMVALGLKAVTMDGEMAPPADLFTNAGLAVLFSTVVATGASWVFRPRPGNAPWYDWVLLLNALAVGGYLLANITGWQFRAGVMASATDAWMAFSGIVLILELTRRVAGLALVIISAIFVLYGFIGPWMPGFLAHSGYEFDRFFTYIYTDNGILGPTTAVSSTYIILFIAFAAFLQATKVGDYFVNFAFAAAGHKRGGPAKVAVFASGLMGMINGTSAGNVVATGSLTIPLMKRVGYKPQMAAAVEAAASSGGQIMPPIMGAGAFIMAEVTGIPYTDLIIAAIIPAVLYFVSVYFIVDLEARRLDMRGLSRDELPQFAVLLRQVYLFIPVVMLIGALFLGYSVIRAGTVALVAALVVSWLTPYRMGPFRALEALNLSARMAIQLIAVCACAGIIVGVIGLTGVGLRFSSVLLSLADQSTFLAMVFAMGISILLGMGMPTTAAYAVAASVVAPGLVTHMGVPPLVAHFFVFYYAVISAITPPVALAAYAGAALAGSEPMRTSVTAFRIGLSAFIVPFMFFYSPALLMEGEWVTIAHHTVTALVGVYLLSGAVVGYIFDARLKLPMRLATFAAALLMIAGGLFTDAIGIALMAGIFVVQKAIAKRQAAGA